MLPETLTLEIVTPERQLVRESVHELQLPGRNGYLGILPGHAPLVTALGAGVLSYRKGQDTHYLAAFHGYAEVLPDRVIVLAEIAERAEEINVDRAQAAEERARSRLSKSDSPDLDWDRASFALERALIRLQAAAKGGAIASAQEVHHTAP